MLCTSGALSQAFPVKPIRILTAEPGAATDSAARLIAQGLTPRLGQPVIVENRGGAGGTIAAQALVKSPPDGHTLLFYSDALWTAPFLRDSVLFDPLRDFSPVTLAVVSPNVLVIHPSLPVKSVKDLIALAKARPGELNYALGIDRFFIASVGGTVPVDGRHRHRPHLLQGIGSGSHRAHGRSGTTHVSVGKFGVAACEDGQTQGAGCGECQTRRC